MIKERPRSSAVKKKPLSLLQQTLKKSRNPSSRNTKLKLQLPVEHPSVCKNHFAFKHVVGKGGFGRVWQVEFKRSKQPLAMKEMLKLRVVSKRSVHSVLNERAILQRLRHPLLANIHFAFQDRQNLYLALDLLQGGDLRYHFGYRQSFSEEQARFFISCIVAGLEYLHVNGVIHRDIKPQNLVFDSKGYLHITDFGIARVITPQNAKDTSGTPGYMAPEVMIRQNHGIGVDYYAVGVIAYEMITGRRPYVGRDRKEIRDHILSKQVQIKGVPAGWSPEAVDFANRLIQRKVEHRLGFNGPHELKSHAWLKDVPWMQLARKELKAPFVPGAEGNFDARVNADWVDDVDPRISQASIQHFFKDYSYDGTQRSKLNDNYQAY